jgi:hypothetical protein
MPLIVLPIYAPSETITSAWANDIRSNFGSVESRTGGDPGVSDRFLVSSSSVAGLWRPLQTSDFGPLVIPDSALASVKVTAAAQALSTFAGLFGANRCGFYSVQAASDGPVAGHSYHCYNLVDAANPGAFAAQLAIDISDVNAIFLRLLISGAPSAWFRLWHSGNDGAGSGLDADLLDGISSGSFARVDAPTNFTTVPTINGQAIIRADTIGSQSVASAANAGTLDNIDSTSFARVDAASNFTVAPSISGYAIITAQNIGTQTVANAANATNAGTAGVANSVAAGVISDISVQSANKDGSIGTPSMRTIGGGAQQAAGGNHLHTGVYEPAAAHQYPAAGSYVGNGSAAQFIGTGVSAKVILVTEFSGPDDGCSAVLTPSKTVTTKQVSGTVSMDCDNTVGISGTTLQAGLAAGINAAGKTYSWIAIP